MITTRHLTILVCLAMTPGGSLFSREEPNDANAERGPSVRLTGWMSVVWPDVRGGEPADPVYDLTTTDGEHVHVRVPPGVLRSAGGVAAINRREVVAEGRWADDLPPRRSARRRFQATRIHPVHGKPLATARTTAAAAEPPTSWISLLCKYSDFTTEPKPLAYFQDMYASSYPGMDHYWLEASSGQHAIAGSGAVGWVTMPQTRSYYVYDDDGDGSLDLDLDRVFDDCTAAADSLVNFTAYGGINIMLNADSGGSAWGGGQYVTLDGEQRFWSVTWEPPWAYESIAVIAHEMGHGLGLPHSSGTYGQTYDNEWDVMSSTWANCGRSTHSAYGCLGQHTITYHRDLLGWLSGEQKYVHPGELATVTLQRAALPTGGAYVMARVPIDGSETRFYTVELRQWAGYDVKLPGEGVIIHEVDGGRQRPANVIDADGNGDTGDAGAIWTPGEVFEDAANRITITVDAISGNTATITIESPAASTVTLASSSNPSNENDGVTFTATVTSGATGTVEFTDWNEVIATRPVEGGVATFTTSALAPGWHSIRAVYSGDATYAGSSSAVVEQQVRFATSVTVASSPNPAAHGAAVTFVATVLPSDVNDWVEFRSAATTICWAQVSAGSASCEANFLDSGTHTITARLRESFFYAESTSAALYQVVEAPANAPAAVTATAVSVSQILVTWPAVPGAVAYWLYRLEKEFGWTARYVTTNSYTDTGLAAGATYLYRVSTVMDSGTSSWSPPDAATTIFFSDSPIAAGSTLIRATHMTELRSAANAMRATAGLPAAVFDDVPGTTVAVKALHMQQVRNAIASARAAMLLPPTVMTDPTLVRGATRVKAVHVEEMRSATR